jgi:RNA polymerase sigma-70 factor (ECF subfamily)
MPSREPTVDDADLVRRARDGDAQAFEELVIRHQDRVYTTLLRMVGDASTAADLAQEVFVKAWRGVSEVDDRAKFSTWLHRVAHNEAVSHFRHAGAIKRGGARRDVSLSRDDAPDVGRDLRRPGAESANPADTAESNEQTRIILDAIDGLDPESRMVVVLREVEGLSYDEIADRLGINAGTVRSRLFRARERLRERLARVL